MVNGFLTITNYQIHPYHATLTMSFFASFDEDQTNEDDDPFSPIPLAENAICRQEPVEENKTCSLNVRHTRKPLETFQFSSGGLRGEEDMDVPVQLSGINDISNTTSADKEHSVTRLVTSLQGEDNTMMDISSSHQQPSEFGLMNAFPRTMNSSFPQNLPGEAIDSNYFTGSTNFANPNYVSNTLPNIASGRIQHELALDINLSGNNSNNAMIDSMFMPQTQVPLSLAYPRPQVQPLQSFPAGLPAMGERLTDAALAAFQRAIILSRGNDLAPSIAGFDSSLMLPYQNNSMGLEMLAPSSQPSAAFLPQHQQSMQTQQHRRSFPSSGGEQDENFNDSRFKPFHEEKWALRYKELIDFHQENGHSAVPHTYPPNPQLARWVKRQRRQYKLLQENKPSTMTLERLELLNMLDFIWDSHEVNWREKLLALDAFRMEHGHCNVASNYHDKKLATWVKCQRRQYKLYCEGKGSAMCPRRIQELEGRGFEWEIRISSKQQDREQEREQDQESMSSSEEDESDM